MVNLHLWDFTFNAAQYLQTLAQHIAAIQVSLLEKTLLMFANHSLDFVKVQEINWRACSSENIMK